MCYYLGKTRQACEAREGALAEQEEKESGEAQAQKRPDDNGFDTGGQAPKAAA